MKIIFFKRGWWLALFWNEKNMEGIGILAPRHWEFAFYKFSKFYVFGCLAVSL